MAKKKKTMYVCQQCGYDTPKWMGRCPGCGAWNTMVEEVVAPETRSVGGSVGLAESQPPRPIGEIETEDLPRYGTGSGELDRVLGGGVIPGSLVLIVGDPGVGKSSLTIRVCAEVARTGKRVLYVTGEESAVRSTVCCARSRTVLAARMSWACLKCARRGSWMCRTRRNCSCRTGARTAAR